MKIYFVTHGTTTDNEEGIASGHKDVGLSESGISESKELPNQLKDISFDIVFCSDLKRAVDTANIAFKGKKPIIVDQRLREVNYGDLNGARKELVYPKRTEYINKPFPSGESYEQRKEMMKEFLNEVKEKYPNKNILITGHRATQWSLDVLINGKTFKEVIEKPFKWQPYWEYNL